MSTYVLLVIDGNDIGDRTPSDDDLTRFVTPVIHQRRFDTLRIVHVDADRLRDIERDKPDEDGLGYADEFINVDETLDWITRAFTDAGIDDDTRHRIFGIAGPIGDDHFMLLDNDVLPSLGEYWRYDDDGSGAQRVISTEAPF